MLLLAAVHMLVAGSTHVTARSWQALEPQQAKKGRLSMTSRGAAELAGAFY